MAATNSGKVGTDTSERPYFFPADHPKAKIQFCDPSFLARRVFWHMFAVFDTTLQKPDVHERSEKPGAYVLWVHSGEGELRLGQRRFRVAPGNRAWLINMNEKQVYIPAAGQPLHNEGFRFSGPALEAWLELLTQNRHPEIQVKDLEFLRSSRRKLSRLVARKAGDWEWQIHNIITDVLGHLLATKHLLEHPVSKVPAAVTRVLEAIAADPLKDWLASELASVARISYSHLRDLFRKSQNKSMHQEIQETRLRRAQALLSDKRVPIREIASQMNFSSEFYFSTFFKRRVGISPREFRTALENR